MAERGRGPEKSNNTLTLLKGLFKIFNITPLGVQREGHGCIWVHGVPYVRHTLQLSKPRAGSANCRLSVATPEVTRIHTVNVYWKACEKPLSAQALTWAAWRLVTCFYNRKLGRLQRLVSYLQLFGLISAVKGRLYTKETGRMPCLQSETALCLFCCTGERERELNLFCHTWNKNYSTWRCKVINLRSGHGDEDRIRSFCELLLKVSR